MCDWNNIGLHTVFVKCAMLRFFFSFATSCFVSGLLHTCSFGKMLSDSVKSIINPSSLEICVLKIETRRLCVRLDWFSLWWTSGLLVQESSKTIFFCFSAYSQISLSLLIMKFRWHVIDGKFLKVIVYFIYGNFFFNLMYIYVLESGN